MIKRLLHAETLTEDLLQFFSRRESEIELESLRKNGISNLHFKFFYYLRISWVFTVEPHENCSNVSKLQSLYQNNFGCRVLIFSSIFSYYIFQPQLFKLYNKIVLRMIWKHYIKTDSAKYLQITYSRVTFQSDSKRWTYLMYFGYQS